MKHSLSTGLKTAKDKRGTILYINNSRSPMRLASVIWLNQKHQTCVYILRTQIWILQREYFGCNTDENRSHYLLIKLSFYRIQ